MDIDGGELGLLNATVLADLSQIQLGDEHGQKTTTPDRWMASIDAQVDLQPDERQYVLTTVTWKFLVSLEFRDDDFDEQPLIDGRILGVMGQATTQLMPAIS